MWLFAACFTWLFAACAWWDFACDFAVCFTALCFDTACVVPEAGSAWPGGAAASESCVWLLWLLWCDAGSPRAQSTTPRPSISRKLASETRSRFELLAAYLGPGADVLYELLVLLTSVVVVTVEFVRYLRSWTPDCIVSATEYPAVFETRSKLNM